MRLSVPVAPGRRPVGLRCATLLLMVAAPALASLAGCGEQATAAPPPPVTSAATTGADGVQRVTITGNDALQFVPSTVRVHPGKLIITFTVTGTSPHTLGVEELHAETGNVNAHATTTLELTLPAAGSYELECDYHPLMRGRLVVS